MKYDHAHICWFHNSCMYEIISNVAKIPDNFKSSIVVAYILWVSYWQLYIEDNEITKKASFSQDKAAICERYIRAR